MRIDSISDINNTNFKAGNIRYQKVSHLTKLNQANHSNGADSVLLYFAGLLDAFGFKKPLNKLISSLK